jgi:hydrogenase expression/formation protein HypC
MCLAIPGRILEISMAEGVRVGRLELGGIVRQACLDFVPESVVGDYVMVHVGFAISRVDREEAERTYATLKSAGLLEQELSPEAM